MTKQIKVLIKRASDPELWYSDHIDETVDVNDEDEHVYYTVLHDGRLAYIRKSDCEVID